MVPPPVQLDAAVLCALGGAVKAKALTDAKAALPDGSTHRVDVAVRVHGVVTKGVSEPQATGAAAPMVNLFDRGVVLDLLRRLGATPADVRRHLKAATKAITAPAQLGQLGQGVIAQDLAAEFERAQTQLQGRLPVEPWTRPGRAGAVRAEVTVTLLDVPPCPPLAIAA